MTYFIWVNRLKMMLSIFIYFTKCVWTLTKHIYLCSLRVTEKKINPHGQSEWEKMAAEKMY